MSALAACGLAPPATSAAASTPADAAGAVAPDGAVIGNGDAGAVAADSTGADSCAPSFQQLLGQALAVDAALTARAVPAAPNVAPTVGGDAAMDGAAASGDSADDVLAHLLQPGAPPASTAGAAAAPGMGTPKKAGGSDADSVTQDDTLAQVLAALSQLGFVPQPVATAPAPAATDAATAAVADGPQLPGLLPKQPGAAPEAPARWRPGPALALLAAADDGAAQLIAPADGTPTNPIHLRDLLDGNRDDATAGVRDPAETAPPARSADAGGALQAAPNETARPTDGVSRTISIPVQHPRWAEAVASDIRWFAEQGVQSATLRLTPEHLGPVEVRLSLTDSKVTVNFAAASADTRAALENSLPRLRDMLAGAGLSLGEAQVQQQMRQGSQNGFNSGGGAADTDVRDTLARVPMRLGLVDEYA